MTNKQWNAGHYETLMRQWVSETILGKRWEKHDDLHIDELDAQFKSPGQWVAISLFCLNYLTSIIDKSKYEVLLAIPLTEAEISIPVEALSLADFEQFVGWTPPSFYLFPTHHPVLTATISTAFYLPHLGDEGPWRIYLKEVRRDEELIRTLLIKPHPRP